MGKRKSAKPQKYVQQSDEEDENLDFYDDLEENVPKRSSLGVSQPSLSSDKNVRSLWAKEKLPEIKNENHVVKETSESIFWAKHLPLTSDGTSNDKFNLDTFKIEAAHVPDSFRESNTPAASHGSPLETLLSDRAFASSNPFLEERLRMTNSMNNSRSLSGTESDRKSLQDVDVERRATSRPKRRRKYVTYPATFRLEVVEHAERFGKSSAAKKYNICVEKVSMWCKTKDNIVHKVKKGGHTSMDGGFDSTFEDRADDHSVTGTPERVTDDVEMAEAEDKQRQEISQDLEMLYNDESDGSDRYESDMLRRPDVAFPPHFKHRVAVYAEEHGEKAASQEFRVCEKRVALWCQVREYLSEYFTANKVEEWEVDLYVTLKRLLEENYQVTVRDLIVRAEKAQLNSSSTNSTISTAWLTDWCQKFKVCFRSVVESTPQPLTENTCLSLETRLYQPDREELQVLALRGKKPSKIQDLIECSRALDASPSASDREDSLSSFSFNSKRRRRSYTLAFKLEVVKFAQSHTKHATSRKYGIARRVISRWIADKEVLQTDLLNATQQVLNDTGVDDVDHKMLKWYKELKRKGQHVTKSLMMTHLKEVLDEKNSSTRSHSSDNNWLGLWLLKCKELGEQIEIDEEEEPKPSSSNSVPVSQSVLDLHNANHSEGSSLNALKQAYMTNAILNSVKPTEMDLKLMTQFPELLTAIQQNPAILNAAAQMQSKDSELYKACTSSLQAIMNYCKERSGNENDSKPVRSFYESPVNLSTTDDKKKVVTAKKRRERYSPDFKLKVIDYAASHSYQETSRKYGVHHITVSEWCKDKERIRKKVYNENLQTLHTKILKSETAEQKFLSWIQDCNKHKVVIKPIDVQNKANEILNIIGEAEVKKNCWWFYLWNKRGMDSERLFDEEADVDMLEKESRVNYPPAVKIEIAKVAERQSVNCAARCFRVARKRIREWVKSKDKLKWLAETGQVRERAVNFGGRKVDCLEVDREVYDWYSGAKTSSHLPGLEEIRTKALEIFQKHGFTNMKCSREWYKNWCKRFGVSRTLQKDSRIIRWILARYDKNLPVTNQELVSFVSGERMKAAGVDPDDDDRPADDRVVAFCRRYPKLLESLPGVTETFPEEMEREVAKFRATVRELQEENGFSALAVGCMDEIPLLFSSGGPVIVNCGMDSCNVVVVLSCLADGTFLPPLVVLKGPEHTPFPADVPHVLFRERFLVDHGVMRHWAEQVWLASVPSPSLLLMDCFEPHLVGSVQDAMLESGITPVVVPEGCASKLQPLAACLTRNFQESVQEIWNARKPRPAVTDTFTPNAATSPSPEDIARCIAEAFRRLRTRKEVIRQSFMVTGIAVSSPDGTEDVLVQNPEWFGGSGDEHVLSPATESELDSDAEA